MLWEYFGAAEVVDNFVDIGGVKVPHYMNGDAHIYVRRDSESLVVMEIGIAMHDGLAQCVLDQENEEAEQYPLGKKSIGVVRWWGNTPLKAATLTLSDG